jgi:mannose-6-phosphate isomerase-like protein (cupin superfamily)
MPQKALSVSEAAAKLTKPFTHTVLGQVDEYCAYLSRFRGSYKFHEHAKDEMYIVLEGEVCIDYGDGTCVALGEGDTLVVKANEVHRSRSEEGALVMMFKAVHLFAE